MERDCKSINKKKKKNNKISKKNKKKLQEQSSNLEDYNIKEKYENQNTDQNNTNILPLISTLKENVSSPCSKNKQNITSDLKKKILNDIDNKKIKIARSSRKETHYKNLQFIKKLSEKIEVIKINQSQSPDLERNSIEKNKLVKHYYGKIDKKRNEIYYYKILPGNNSNLIRKCIEYRYNWKEDTIGVCNFLWQQTSVGIDYTLYNKFSNINKIVNHFEYHRHISNKMNLFINLIKYCELKNIDLWTIIPLTVVMDSESKFTEIQFNCFKYVYENIKEFLNLKESKRFIPYSSYFSFNSKDNLGNKTDLYIPPNHYIGNNLWIIKAVDLNRGRCIKIARDLLKISKIINKFKNGVDRGVKDDDSINSNIENINSSKQKHKKYKTSIVILQKYIENPLLYKGRKFDIRLWVLLTHKMDLLVFKEGHLKTCSIPFDINIINSFIHLTNYSVQKYNECFSKYEEGNEVSFTTFQEFLNKEYSTKGINIYLTIFPKMCNIVKITMLSVKDKINIFERKSCFEIFGYDFILDKEFNPYLLEVNTNPGLEESSNLIREIVPRMIDDCLRLTIDDLFTNNSNIYRSPFSVKGYQDDENMWQYICNVKDKEFVDFNKTGFKYSSVRK